MRLAVVVGLPPEQAKRLKAFVERGLSTYKLGWSVKYVSARKNFPEILDAHVSQAMDSAAETNESHIIGVSKQDGRIRQEVAGRIREHFRFRWLDNALLYFLGDQFQEFVIRFNDVLQEEEFWSEKVKPSDSRSPLLLPKMSFDARHPQGEIWAMSEQYGEIGNIAAAATALEKFRDAYWNSTTPERHHAGGRRWIDSSDRVFDHSGARHGAAPFPRNWKYSYKIEEGFHFDVSDRNGRGFSVIDYSNSRHVCSENGYINIDPHGHVRTAI